MKNKVVEEIELILIQGTLNRFTSKKHISRPKFIIGDLRQNKSNYFKIRFILEQGRYEKP